MKVFLLSLILVLAAMAQSFSAPCSVESAEISATPIIEQVPRRLALAKRYAGMTGNLDTLIIGDSIAEFWKAYQPEDFPNMPVVNMGLAGERTQELRWRLKELPPKINPSRVILIIGTNNLAERRYDRCEVYGGIIAAAQDIKTLWPKAKLFLIPILPRGTNFRFRDDDRTAINAMLAPTPGVTIVQVNEDVITCRWADSCNNYRADRLHLTKSGYLILLKTLHSASFIKN